MLLTRLLICSILLSHSISLAQSASGRKDGQGSRLWTFSLIAVTVASGVDATTSWGKREGNGLLASSDGTFGIRGVSIKAGLIGATLIPQIWLRHRPSWRRRFTIANAAEASAFAAVSAHNAGVR